MSCAAGAVILPQGQVFAVEWCDCIHESAFAVVSLHTTKRAAFKAMVKRANALWYEERHLSALFGRDPRCRPLMFQAWRVAPMAVEEDGPDHDSARAWRQAA